MATIRVNAGGNAYANTIKEINNAKDGDTISVPNEECAQLVRNNKEKFLFVEIRK